MTPPHLLRKKLTYRATYRSVKEADLLLAPLACALKTLPEAHLAIAEALLDERDDVLLNFSRTSWPEAYAALWRIAASCADDEKA